MTSSEITKSLILQTDGSMKVIKTFSGEEIFVDDEDFEYLSQFKWQVSKTNPTNKYALRHAVKNGKKTKFYLHREIMNFPNGLVDHIDRNGLNCQKTNLRVVNKSQNAANSKNYGAIPFKGVTKHPKGYQMQFKHEGIIVRKLYKTPELAAKHYNDLSMQYRPEYANINKL